MKRLLPASAAIALLAIPAAAQAAPQSGVVLRVERSTHRVEVVDGSHAVRSYALSRRAGRMLRAGARVSFSTRGGRMGAVRVTGRQRSLSFYGKIVNSGARGLVLRLGDGQGLRLGARQLSRHAHGRGHRRAHRASVQINLEGLRPGQVVLITEAVDAAGNTTITIKLEPGASPNGNDQEVTGAISALGDGSVTVQVDGGGMMTFQADSDLLDGFKLGDQVDVTYYTDSDGSLVPDDIEWVDASSGSEDLDAIGTVTALGDGTISVQVDGQGVMTFAADNDLLDGVAVGDAVDLTYFQDTDGTLVADDVEPADNAGDTLDG